MFSEKIYADIWRVSRQALEELRSVNAIDQVTIVQGYLQLSAASLVDYDPKLRTAIGRLLDLARREKQPQVVDALEGLTEAIDRERAA